jgi:glycosyltransferase involved in cell wall biosynthesis
VSTRQQPSHNHFAVVIPVYNHGGTVADVVRSVSGQGLPVIVVDDGSTDGTSRQLQSIQGIRVLHHPHNRGKGAALITGMTEAARTAAWAVCLDADGQHDPGDIPALIGAIAASERPIVIGRRQMMTAAPWTSRFGRKFSNFWVWASSGVYLNDTQSGFRIYPLPEVLDLDVEARRYQYEVEVLAKAVWNGIPIKEAPVGVCYDPGGRRISHFHPWRDFLRNSRTFCRLIVRRVFSPKLWRPRRPARRN